MSPENSNDFESAHVSCAMHLQKYRLHKARIENFCKSAKKNVFVIFWYFISNVFVLFNMFIIQNNLFVIIIVNNYILNIHFLS